MYGQRRKVQWKDGNGEGNREGNEVDINTEKPIARRK